MAGFNQTFLEIIGGTPGTCLVEHGIYVRPAAAMTAAAYGSERVLVMGDAAHPLRPTGELAHRSSILHGITCADTKWPPGRDQQQRLTGCLEELVCSGLMLLPRLVR
jgi:hypothetical protein